MATLEKIKVSELDIPNRKKAILGFLVKRRTTLEVAAKFDANYSNVHTELSIYALKGYIRKIVVPKPRRTYWILDQNRVEL